MPASGEVTPTPTPAPTPTPTPALAAGHIAISEAEHNRTNAELRRLKKEAADREAADAASTVQADREAAEARGQYDTALAAEQTARAAAETRLTALASETALLQEITRRGFGGEQAAALIKLTDASTVTADAGAEAAVEAAIAKYPALFKATEIPKPTPGTPAPAPGAPQNLPPASPIYGKGHETIDGFLTMEEFLRTPAPERITEAFLARVAKSEPFWPSEVPASSFTQET